jgi:hypothetical protein
MRQARGVKRTCQAGSRLQRQLIEDHFERHTTASQTSEQFFQAFIPLVEKAFGPAVNAPVATYLR